MSGTSRFIVFGLALCLSSMALRVRAGGAGDSPAAAGLQEVLVTASLRHEPALQLPASVTVLGAAALHGAGQQNLQDVLALVPNLNWASGSSLPRYFQLRGVGETEQWQGAPNPSVGIILDDIDFSGVGMVGTLFDLSQAEVLRGPQGTAYGANALAGLIKLSSREPQNQPERWLEASIGDFNSRSLGAVLGGALDANSAWAGRLAAQRFRSDGYRYNAFLGRNDTNGYDETTVRGRLRWDASPQLRWLLTGLWIDLDNGYDAFSLDNSRITQSDKPGRDMQRSQAASLRADYDGNSRFALSSATGIASSAIRYSFDGDWGHDSGYDFTSRFLRQHDTLSEDLRLVSRARAAAAGQWAWVSGVYALRVTERNDQLDLYDGDIYRALISDYRATSLALYGQLQWRPVTPVRLSAGLRVEQRQVHYSDSDGTQFAPSNQMLGGNLSLEYSLAANNLAYLTLSRGYKAGGFNIGAAIPEALRGFNPEFLWNLEAGLKRRSASGALQSQLSVFSMRRSAMQVSTSVQLQPGDPLSFIYVTTNASRGENSGLEGSVSWQATPQLTLSGTLGLLQTRFIDYQNGDRNLDGRDQAHAPRHQESLVINYRAPQGLRARLEVNSSAGFYFSDSDDQRAQPRSIVNASLGWQSGSWFAEFHVRNALNGNAVQQGYYFGNEPPDFPDKLYTQHGDPRQIGITLRVDLR